VEAMKKVTTILRLGKKNYFIGLQNLEAKEIMKIPTKPSKTIAPPGKPEGNTTHRCTAQSHPR
jgi:hypothetical protein